MRIRPEVEPIKMFARAEDKKLQSEIDFFMMSKHGRERSRRAIAHFAQQSLLECAHTSSALTQFLLCICCQAIRFLTVEVAASSSRGHVAANCCSERLPLSKGKKRRKHSRANNLECRSTEGCAGSTLNGSDV